MDAAALIPLPDTIPVSWGWFQLLLLLTFFLHLLCMNMMLGSAVILLVKQLRHPAQLPPAGRELAGHLPFLIAFAVNLGVAPLLFLQVLYGQFIYTSSILMGVYWLAVVAILILAYGGAYLYNLKHDALGKRRNQLIILVTGGLVAIAFIFSNNMSMMLRPDTWPRYFDQPGGTLLNLADPTLLPRWLHFITAAVATGGLYLAAGGRWRRLEPAAAAARVTEGMHWFVGATSVQLGIGTWFFFSLPDHIRQLFTGTSTLHTGLLLTGCLAALISLGLGLAKRLWPTIGATIATILIMVLIRDLVRRAYLAPYFSPDSLVVAPQYSPMVIFWLALLLGLGIIAYMLRLALNAGKESGETPS